jgi:OmpR-family two-component system manganese-sensing response regulator
MIASPQVEKLVTQETDKSAPRRILCVEDDRDTCEVLRFVMTDYDFTTVSSVAAAEELIRSQKFDIYVLDNWLPDGSGVDLCEKIRQLGSTSPIVFTSAVGQRHDIELAMNAGADRYLVKPYEPETLVRTVKELLNQSSELAFES